MAKKKSKKKKTSRARPKTAKKTASRKGASMSMAIIALLLNVLILPGLGSLIGGKTKVGIWQLIIAIIGIILSIIIIGIPILIAAWIWGIVTGVQMIQEAR
jgi:TM2 domain-containing membrane protein YozV